MSAPDVIFGADDENFLPFLAWNGEGEGNANSPKNSLSDWNGRDPTRLMVLIQQLRSVISVMTVFLMFSESLVVS